MYGITGILKKYFLYYLDKEAFQFSKMNGFKVGLIWSSDKEDAYAFALRNDLVDNPQETDVEIPLFAVSRVPV